MSTATAHSPLDVSAVAQAPHSPLTSTRRQLAALCDRQVRRTLRAPGKFIGIAMNPVVMIVALGFVFADAFDVPPDVDYSSYVVAGVAVQVGLSCIGPTAISIAVDRKAGLLVRSQTMSVRGWTSLVAQVLADLAAATAALVLVTAIGLVIGWRPDASPLNLASSYVLLAGFFTAVIWAGVLLGLLISNPETLEPLGALLLVLFSFLSNAFLPPDVMPEGIRQIAEWNPVSAVASTCRDLWGLPRTSGSTSFASSHPALVAVLSVVALLVVAVTLSVRTAGRIR